MSDPTTLPKSLNDLKIRYEGVLTMDDLVLKYKNHPLTQEEESKLPDCLICYEKMRDTDEKTKLTPCGHEFHTHCIENWFGTISKSYTYKKKLICPMCGVECRRPLDETKCNAVTRSGLQCKNKQKYGMFCGIHKSLFSSDVV